MVKEHDGCEKCIHERKEAFEYPCNGCRGTKNPLTEDYKNSPDLWEEESKHDSVNHPSHYCQEGSMECIEEMIILFGKEETMSFCKLNAWKYRKRALFKNGEEDMKKSDWYLNKYKELKEGGLID